MTNWPLLYVPPGSKLEGMKTTRRILGVVWLALCVYFSVNLASAFLRAHSQPSWVALILSYLLLYLVGAIAAWHLFLGERWAGLVISIVAVLTVGASVMGFFMFFNQYPLSPVGMIFDVFSVCSATILFPSRRASEPIAD